MVPFFDFGQSRQMAQNLTQNLTTWAIGLSNQILSRRILHCRTAYEDRFLFQIEKYKSEALNRIA